MTEAANILLSGALEVTSGSGRLEPGLQGTFTYDGAGPQSVVLGVSGINYHNLVLTGGDIKTQTFGPIATITGTTTVAAGTQFNNRAQTIYQGGFINNGTTVVSAEQQYQGNFTNTGSYSASAAQNYQGDFTNTGTFASGSQEHRFNGNTPQLITGETTFSVVAFDNSADVTLANDVLVEDRIPVDQSACRRASFTR